MQNYLVNQTKRSGAVISLGGVLATDDQHALLEAVKLVKSKIGTPGFDLDDLISISKPDGTLLCAPATVAEFVKK